MRAKQMHRITLESFDQTSRSESNEAINRDTKIALDRNSYGQLYCSAFEMALARNGNNDKYVPSLKYVTELEKQNDDKRNIDIGS